MSLPVIAIVGRPNVGKSTLFNRLIGFRKSVVHDRPGVTRDRLYERAELMDHPVLLVDTGGIEPDPEEAARADRRGPDADMLRGMRRQVEVAIEEATVIIFLVDGRTGYTAADNEVADLLRRSHKPIVLAVNKCDGPKQEELAADFWQVGIPELLTVSAEHGLGMYELAEAVCKHLPTVEPLDDETEEGASEELAVDDEDLAERGEVIGLKDEVPAIRVAVIGRPNIGKSTLINHLLGEERQVVHDSPGTTMDPVDTAFDIGDSHYVLVDTAGVRRKSRIEDSLERFVSLRSIQAIERSHVCLLMIDAAEGITDQDAKLADLVVQRGRALILLFNKWDLVKTMEDVDAASVEEAKRVRLPHASFAPHLFISAKTGKGTHRILPMVDEVFKAFNKHIGTAEVNRFLQRVVSTHTPPQRHHHPVRLYYAAQTRVRPPTIALFSNTPEGLVESYKSYLINRLREDYGLIGTPIRMHARRRRKIGESNE